MGQGKGNSLEILERNKKTQSNHLINSPHLEDHGELGSLLGLLQLLLGLAELGQVEGGDLLGLLDLLLVSLELHLELAGQLGHAVLVLLVLSLGKVQLLGLALSPLVSLHGLATARLSGGKLGLQLTDLSFHLGHGGLASLQGGVLRVSRAALQLAQGVGERVLASGQAGHVLLLGSQLVSKTGSVNHRLLGLVFGVLGGDKHAVHLSLQGVDAGLQLALGGHVASVDGLHVVNSGTAVSDVVLQLPDGTVGSIQQGLALLNLARQGSSLTLRDADLLSDLSPGAGLVLKGLDGLTELGLVALDGLDSLRVGLVGVVQANLQLVDFSLQLLLDAESLALGSLLGLDGGSQGLHGAGVVLPGVVELLLLLGHTPVNLLPHVGKLQLGAEHLVLLHLQGGLGLLKSALQLLLLSLQHPPLFVQGVDGAASLTELIKQILDLVSEVLVLPLDNVQLLGGLLLGGLQAEELAAVVAALVLGGSDLGGEVGSLGLPLSKHLVEVLGSLLSDQSSGVHSLVLHGEIVQVSGLPALGLLSVGHLGGENIHQLLVLHDLGLQLVASSLKLLDAAHSLGLEAGLPQLSLSLGLGEGLE